MNDMLAGLGPTHPGEILREDILPALGQPRAALARMLGISRQHLYDILDEKKPISTQMALRLGKLLGNSPEMWLRMQLTFDLAVQRKAMTEELERIPTLQAA